MLRLFPILCGGHRQLALENLALRQQLAVYKRTMARPKLRRSDRLFWVWLSRVWTGWRDTLMIVAPDTVLRRIEGLPVTRCDAVMPRESGESRPVVTVLVTLLPHRNKQKTGTSARAHSRSLTARCIRRRWWSPGMGSMADTGWCPRRDSNPCFCALFAARFKTS